MSRPAAPVVSTRAGPGLVGRAREITLLDESLGSGAIAELVGPIGIGKTALARAWLSTRARRALWCAASGCSSEMDLRRSISAQLGVPSGDAQLDIDPLILALQGLDIDTLVLDGADALALVLPSLLAPWLAALPRIAVLVTTRTPSRIPDAAIIHLSPLSHRIIDPELGEPAAVALLRDAVERARGGRPLAADEREALPRVAERLEGLPLSLLILGSLARAWSIVELLSQLDRGVRKLASQSPALGRALRTSFELASTSMREDLALVALFRGGTTRQAFAAALGLEESAVRERFAAMIDSSWLLPQVDDAPQREPLRYSMLRVVADWTIENQPEIAAALEARFVRYHVERASEYLRASRYSSVAGKTWLRDERKNVEAALEPAAKAGDLRGASWLAAAIARISCDEGISEALVTRLEGHIAPDGLTDTEHAHLASAIAFAWAALRRLDRAALALRTWDTRANAPTPVLVARAHIAVVGLDPASAHEIARCLLEKETTSPEGAWGHYLDGCAYVVASRYPEALAAFVHAEEALLSCGFDLVAHEVLALRSCCEIELGAIDAGLEHGVRALALLEAHHHHRVAALAALYVALGHLERGDLDEAARRGQEAVAAAQRSGLPQRVSLALAYRGAIAHERGEFAAAVRSYEESSSLWTGSSARRPEGLLPLFRARLAAAYADLGDAVAAERLAADLHDAGRRDAPPTIARAGALHLVHLEIARAHALPADERASIAHRIRSEAEQSAGSEECAGWDERYAQRLLNRALHRLVPARLSLDEATKTVTLPDGRTMTLAQKPVALALLRALRASESVSKEDLCRLVWSRDAYDPLRDDPKLQMAITRLRRLIGDDPVKRWIRTTADGYQLVDE